MEEVRQRCQRQPPLPSASPSLSPLRMAYLCRTPQEISASRCAPSFQDSRSAPSFPDLPGPHERQVCETEPRQEENKQPPKVRAPTDLQRPGDLGLLGVWQVQEHPRAPRRFFEQDSRMRQGATRKSSATCATPFLAMATSAVRAFGFSLAFAENSKRRGQF